MRHLIILCVLFASFNVFADSWFETTTNWFGEIWDLFTIHTPNMFERFINYATTLGIERNNIDIITSRSVIKNRKRLFSYCTLRRKWTYFG